MNPNIRYRCLNCDREVRNARFRFCRTCELQSSPLHPCPGCGGPCRGLQCRQCHKKMYSDRFCTSPDCFGKRVENTQHCYRCITDLYRDQQRGTDDEDQPQQEYEVQTPRARVASGGPNVVMQRASAQNPFAAYTPPQADNTGSKRNLECEEDERDAQEEEKTDEEN